MKFIVIIKNFGTTIFCEVQMKRAHLCEILYIDKITSTDLHISLEYQHVPRLEICRLVLKLSTYELTYLVKKQNMYLHFQSYLLFVGYCIFFYWFFPFFFQVKTTKNKANLDPCPEPVITDLS